MIEADRVRLRKPAALVTDKKAGQMPPSYKTIASFCEYAAEMLEHVADRDELVKRHRDSIGLWSNISARMA